MRQPAGTLGIGKIAALIAGHAGEQVHRQRYRLLRAIRRLGLEELVLAGQYRRGVPPGLDPGELKRTIKEVAGRQMTSVKHRHMSSWKRTGAYRVIALTTASETVSFVFKNADYAEADVGELNGLPLSLGAGEHLVLTSPSARLSRFLPRVYWALEVTPGRAYRYLMEDLTGTHRNFAGDRDRAALVRTIPKLHRALSDVNVRDGSKKLIRWDEAFALQILDNARQNLEFYRSAGCDGAVDRLLRQWPRFESVYRNGLKLAYEEQPVQLIHGDCDPSNLLFEHRGTGVKSIDFEWAGWGLPHHDLVSALRGASEETKTACLGRFSAALGQRPLEADAAIYAHCRLQRELLTATHLAKQWLRAEVRSDAWVRKFVATSCRSVMRVAGLS